MPDAGHQLALGEESEGAGWEGPSPHERTQRRLGQLTELLRAWRRDGQLPDVPPLDLPVTEVHLDELAARGYRLDPAAWTPVGTPDLTDELGEARQLAEDLEALLLGDLYRFANDNQRRTLSALIDDLGEPIGIERRKRPGRKPGGSGGKDTKGASKGG